MYSLVIKGTKEQAARAAAGWNIALVIDGECFDGGITIGKTNAPLSAIVKWFSECNYPPFPIGSLLFYQECYLIGEGIAHKDNGELALDFANDGEEETQFDS